MPFLHLLSHLPPKREQAGTNDPARPAPVLRRRPARALDDCADLGVDRPQDVLEPRCKGSTLLPGVLMLALLGHIQIKDALSKFLGFLVVLPVRLGRDVAVELARLLL